MQSRPPSLPVHKIVRWRSILGHLRHDDKAWTSYSKHCNYAISRTYINGTLTGIGRMPYINLQVALQQDGL